MDKKLKIFIIISIIGVMITIAMAIIFLFTIFNIKHM